MTTKKSELARLKNLGPVSAGWLNAIGIYTKAELAALGAVAAYRRLKAAGYPVSLNLVYAIQGALMDLHWTDLPAALRDELRQAVGGDQLTS